MAQEQTNVKECYQGTTILRSNKLNGEERARYICVLCATTRDIKKMKIICLHFQKMKGYSEFGVFVSISRRGG